MSGHETKTVLLVAAGPRALLPEDLARISGQADVVIAVDAGLELCVAASIRPDLVIGDMDSVSPEAAHDAFVSGVPTEKHSAEKDHTDLALAVEAAKRHHPTELIATGILGGRIDQTLANLGTLKSVAGYGPRILERGLTGWVVPLGTTLTIPACESTLSVVGLTAIRYTLNGVAFPTSNLPLPALSDVGTSNRITASEARFTLHHGVALVTLEEV